MTDADDLSIEAVRPEHVRSLLAIYNESVAGGGHSPMLIEATDAALRAAVRQGRRMGWPLWCWSADGEVVAWAQLRSIAWGVDACHHVADFSMYVRRDWQGRGTAMRIVRDVCPQARRHGFDAVSCWILGGNRRSLALARACGLSLWGRLPRAVRYGDRVDDLEIWGAELDDGGWLARMEARAARRLARRGP